MALFKSDEEKLEEAENKILDKKEFNGRVGQIHHGLSELGLWGVRDNGKTKFQATKFKIYDEKIMIERNRTFINLSNIKEIFQETDKEALIILNTNDIIPIRGKTNAKNNLIEFKAFISILTNLIKDYELSAKNNKSNIHNEETQGKSEDKFDKLIKLGEMHNKGLLSDDEFNSLKKELLSEDTKYSPIESEDTFEPNVCKNCGVVNDSGSIFCSGCGTKLNI